MTAPVEVTPAGYAQAAVTYSRIHRVLTTGIGALSNVLAGTGACAGSDNAGREWTNDYDPAAWDGIDALGDLALGCGQMHDLLQFTAANHANANTQSGTAPDPGALVFPPGSIPIYQPLEPPSMFGGTDAEPTGWGLVRDYVQGEIWPNGHPDQLRAAATAWRAMATSLTAAGFDFPIARPLIEMQISPEVTSILEQHDLVKSQFDAMAEYCQALATSCDGYAGAIDTTKKAVVMALIELVGFIAVDQIVGWAASTISLGTTGVTAQAVMAALLARYGIRIAGIIKGLRTVAASYRAGMSAASTGMSRAAEALMPLLGARPMLAGAGGSGIAGGTGFDALSSFFALRRPALRKPFYDSVVERAERFVPAGTKDEFLTVQADRDVKVPANKTYDDKPWVTELPKTANGKYYIDEANRALYPVDPKWEIGHLSGYEHRKLLAEAEQRGMTQAEFNDFVHSDPSRFAVEDKYGNRSHLREDK
ncbi:GH-E family nuclease [Rhodococcoides fascians]|uniref:GH-E family nuclease n=1 Tax=Rhodococcoides fascians TaxID=1828 RepID=UPI003CEF1013